MKTLEKETLEFINLWKEKKEISRKPIRHYSKKQELLVNHGAANSITEKSGNLSRENSLLNGGISERVINLAKFFFFNEKWNRIIKSWGIENPPDLLQEIYPFFLEEKKKGYSHSFYMDVRRDYVESRIENSKNEENIKYWEKRKEKLENEILLNSPKDIYEEEDFLERTVFSKGFYELRNSRRKFRKEGKEEYSLEISTGFQEKQRERFCEGYSEENEIIGKLDLENMGILEKYYKVWTKDPQGIDVKFVKAWKKDESWKKLEEYIRIDSTWKNTENTIEEKQEGLFEQGFSSWKFYGITSDRILLQYYIQNPNWRIYETPESSAILESPDKKTRYFLHKNSVTRTQENNKETDRKNSLETSGKYIQERKRMKKESSLCYNIRLREVLSV